MLLGLHLNKSLPVKCVCVCTTPSFPSFLWCQITFLQSAECLKLGIFSFISMIIRRITWKIYSYLVYLSFRNSHTMEPLKGMWHCSESIKWISLLLKRIKRKTPRLSHLLCGDTESQGNYSTWLRHRGSERLTRHLKSRYLAWERTAQPLHSMWHVYSEGPQDHITAACMYNVWSFIFLYHRGS